jgi:hypothetical protein
MKTTVDIPSEELEEAMRHIQATSKRQAVVTALVEFNRRRRLAKLVDHLGTFEDFLTSEELGTLREQG